MKTSSKTTTNANSNKLSSSKDKKSMMDEAISLFKKDYFSKAIPIFEELIAANYKPATNNYYLGEIWYYRKKYADAIRHFKTSAMLYDKASYMPKLLLHSRITSYNVCYTKLLRVVVLLLVFIPKDFFSTSNSARVIN